MIDLHSYDSMLALQRAAVALERIAKALEEQEQITVINRYCAHPTEPS